MFMKGLGQGCSDFSGSASHLLIVALIAKSKDKMQMQFLWGVSLMHNTAGSFTTHLFSRVVRKYLYT